MTDATAHANPRVRVIFVQIKCAMGQAYAVAARIADMADVAGELYSTSGAYDLMAKFSLDPGQDPGSFVTSVIQTVPGVTDTYTIIGFNAFTPGQDPA